jgi:RHS repeat-associated protein
LAVIREPTGRVGTSSRIGAYGYANTISACLRDALGSIRAATNAAGWWGRAVAFRPFGEETSTRFDLSTAVEAKGFIGQRFDADAVLQYLNARDYDPKLGMFIQPEWWEVTWPGVGTNRYSYWSDDPVNASDPSGHVKKEAARQAREGRDRNRRQDSSKGFGGKPGMGPSLSGSSGAAGGGIPN